MSSLVLIFKFVKTCASGILGVIIVANGISFSFKSLRALSANKRDPLVETITGSTTIGQSFCDVNLFTIISINTGLETIPILIASG